MSTQSDYSEQQRLDQSTRYGNISCAGMERSTFWLISERHELLYGHEYRAEMKKKTESFYPSISYVRACGITRANLIFLLSFIRLPSARLRKVTVNARVDKLLTRDTQLQ